MKYWGLKAIIISFSLFVSWGCDYAASGPPLDRDAWSKPGSAGPVAEGAINGKAWRFRQGKLVTLHHRGRTIFIISLWDEVYPDPCKEDRGSDFQVRLQVLGEENSWEIDSYDPFKNYPLLIFSDLTSDLRANHNMVASTGRIAITAIHEDHVSGELWGAFPHPIADKTEVSGSFSVPFCGSL